MDTPLHPPAQAVLPARAMALDGASNFRDLGGYSGLDGARVRWRTLFRSDHLAALSADDVKHLHKLGLAHSLDFRGQQESAQTAYTWAGITRHALTIEPTAAQRAGALLAQGEELTAARTVELMQETYRSFVRNSAARFARFFQLLLTCQTPLVFHCTAGKDRTGWAAAVLLSALGVDEEDILQDYLLSNQFYIPPATDNSTLAAHVLDAFWRVQPSYLHAAMEAVRTDFGSMQHYLRDALAVNSAVRQQLAARYLE